ncbi:MAG: hypothetical protein LBH90_01090 [Tannerella sp.]|jgi:hypothetical protein|nr:hypothetical protein [Tannerella sp.]
MSEDKDLIYDDEDVVEYIQNYLPQELKGKFNDDDINYIIDLIYDFYDTKGFLEGDDDSDIEIDEDELVRFVITNTQKDGFGKYEAEEIMHLIQGELAYCESVGLFD